MGKEHIPQNHRALVGTKQKFTVNLFSVTKDYIKPTEFDVLDIRQGTAIIMDMKTFEEKHPTFQLLLKRKGMKKAQWSNPFAIREIQLKNN